MDLVLENRNAPGDCVVMTHAVAELHAQYPGQYRTAVRTFTPGVWENNPLVVPEKALHLPRVIRLNYGHELGAGKMRRGHFATGFVHSLARQLNVALSPPSRLPGYIYMSDAEMSTPPDLPAGYWVLLSGVKKDIPVKGWDPTRWQAVVDTLHKDIPIVQAGAVRAGHTHRPLKHAINQIGHTSFRQLIHLIAHSSGVLCGVTAAMHVAAALNKPAVVVAGGREGFWWEAYTNETWRATCGDDPPEWFVPHTFLHTIGRLPCCLRGGCWKTHAVGGARRCVAPVRAESTTIGKCMSLITPQQVVDAVHAHTRGIPLAPDPLPASLGAPLEYVPAVTPPRPPVRPAIRAPRRARDTRHIERVRIAAAHEDILPITICTLFYGDYPDLARRCLGSILATTPQNAYQLRVGLNAVKPRSRSVIDKLVVSAPDVRVYEREVEPFKYPMMRRMFREPEIATDWIVWFDDDSYVERGWYQALVRAIKADPAAAMFGKPYYYRLAPGQVPWIRAASWYRGRPLLTRKTSPISRFHTGGWWALRTSTMLELDWPDPRLSHNGGDVMLGVALHQADARLSTFYTGVNISRSPRRGASQVHPGR